MKTTSPPTQEHGPALYTLIKLPLEDLISRDFAVTADRETEILKGWRVSQGDSLLFAQIRRLSREESDHISQVILVSARKNPRQAKALRRLMEEGFSYNGVHYSRFGKSASQGRAGITAFVCDELFDELYRISQLDIPVDNCVISKYEAQRCLIFSTCTLIQNELPNIVIVGEYQKLLYDQQIKYAVERQKEYTDPDGEAKTCRVREIQEGRRDILLSPFDGCGCHEWEVTENISSQLGLEDPAIGVQIRLPFMKGYSVYVPFRRILKEWGIDTITDIYGVRHPVDTIDCIWNTSMFKGHKLFLKQYGSNAWPAYVDALHRYGFQLGISKHSHRTSRRDRYTRMNFQYLQCLDLWNPRYVKAWEDHALDSYDILDSANDGKLVRLARYTTGLWERILRGDPFTAYKFLGLSDTGSSHPKSRYLEAALLHPAMLRDPAVHQFLYRKLKKAIDEAKVGRIYCSGLYHTGVGDMIGYLQYAAGLPPVGCLKAHELYSGNFDCQELISFRSPLVDPSEVNRIALARNETLEKWFGYLKNEDIVMFNMYDLSAPQQGGADFDGDIFFLCDDPAIIASKIDKPIVLDMEDKAVSREKPYTPEHLVEYELMTRDNRIGEITNAATSIENRYTTDARWQKQYEDYASLLRIFQGKEIDFLKTGVRWHMSSTMKKHAKQLPYFLLYNYPEKLKAYESIARQNQKLSDPRDRIPQNAYRSPSPMNELCDYICTWEKRRILWNRDSAFLADTKALITVPGPDPDQKTRRCIRRHINTYAQEVRRILAQCQDSSDGNLPFQLEETAGLYRQRLRSELGLTGEEIANYVIKVSYDNRSISKALAWNGYGDYIIRNLKAHVGTQRPVTITRLPQKACGSLEYLGRYYEYKEDPIYE